MKAIITFTDGGYINAEADEITECDGFFYAYNGKDMVAAARKEIVKEIHLSEKG